jgi:putative membrane protein
MPQKYANDSEDIDMAGMLLRWLILTAAILAASYILDGIVVRDFLSALLAAAVLGILNAFLRPLLILLTLPLNVLSLGLFTFVINASLLKLASFVIGGFEVHGFWAALFGALIITIVSALLNALTRPDMGRVGCGGHGQRRDEDVIDLERKDGNRWS